MSTNSSGRSEWINAIKATCIALVVLLHVSQWIYTLNDNSFWYSICLFLQPFRIPVFFLVSGVLAFNSIYNKKLKAFLRVKNIFSVYIVWTTVMTLRLYFTNDGQDAPEIYHYIVNFLIPGHYWYIWALPFFYLISLLYVYFFRNPFVLVVASFFLNIFAGDLGIALRELYDDTAEHVYWEQTFSNYLWFVIGLVLSKQLINLEVKKYIRKGNFIPRSFYTSLVVFGVALIIVQNWLFLPSQIATVGFVVLTFLIFPALPRKVSRILSDKLGHRTLEIYVFHKLILIVLMAIATRVPLVHNFIVFLGVSAVPVLVISLILLSIIIGDLVKKSVFRTLITGQWSAKKSV